MVMPPMFCCATWKSLGQESEQERQERLGGGEGKTDSFFNIRLAGDVFLHSCVCLCVHFPEAVSFPALGITQLSPNNKKH